MNATDIPQPDGGTPVTDPVAVARVHERLLVPNFPPRELVSVEELLEDVARGSATVRVVGEASDPVAVAITATFTGSPAVLLSYVAIRADQRGRGVGTALLSGLLAGITADPEVSVVLAEVEHPAHHQAHPVYGDPAARLRFYARLGGRILEVPYFQPPVDETQDAVYGMLLLVLAPLERFVHGQRLLPEAGLAAALEEFMAGTDAQRFPVGPVLEAAGHPDGVRMLAADEVGLAPVTRRP
ncbi:GNAT family N-acetyltransferase [Citricoccus sp. I39-566]|uniref:GNAT family N-acetyltransferase n=1 Tax=Citricoccus sp. I39-566 TaxID=3073268 RepID=UPI00286C401E|nr:GNAT family N-acetyltransferase [Citricoccus sp. I39-566]WMY78619.1 GNAT family N-acetyltransferase [Citricoccus sp. I39-566]